MREKMKRNNYFITFVFTIFMICFYNSVSAQEFVIPGGEAVGVKMYTDGLLVVGTSEVETYNGDTVNAARDFKVNDIIKKAGETELTSTEQFSKIINDAENGVNLTVLRNGAEIIIEANPVKSPDGSFKLGIWVRDSTAGIGTVTYYTENSFAALGHGITDVDTGNILTIKSGNILGCKIMSVIKGKRGTPGELNGSFDTAAIGDIIQNTQIGIYGKINESPNKEAIEVLNSSDIECGDAYILSNICGEIKQYSIKITKVNKNSEDSKGLTIEVTDEDLLNLTGGIVQGMSGAPIIQNGKMAGAVTHVFVNDPKKGYGTFVENMLEYSRS